MISDGLPTTERLAKKEIHVPQACHLCQNASEDLCHIFMECPITKKFILNTCQKTADKIERIDTSNRQMEEIMEKVAKCLEREEWTTLCTIWWCTWHHRNKIVFNDQSSTIDQHVELTTQNHIKNWEASKKIEKEHDDETEEHKKQTRIQKRERHLKWDPPTRNWTKCNMDESVKEDGSATWGCIFRNENAQVLHIAAGSGKDISPIVAETWALRLAITEATRLGIDYILLESDSTIVTDAISGVGRCPWEIDMMISDIQREVQHFRGIHIRHIYREANGAADSIARLHHQHPVDEIRTHNEFTTHVRKDAIGCA